MKNNQLIPHANTYSCIIDESAVGMRFDKFLALQFPLYSRSFLARIIDAHEATINGKVAKASSILKLHDAIEVKFLQEEKKEVPAKKEPDVPIQIIHTDGHFLVLNKPAGLLVHEPDHDNQEFTIVDWLLKHHKEIANIGAIDRPGIVHRLDKDTSGVILIARTNFGHTQFTKMFDEKKIQKTYHAIVQGHPPASGIIDAPIGRNKFNRTKMAVAPDITGPAREAISHYKVLEYFDDAALIEVKPITGRTHQIRVHLASIGHPILGDKVYGAPSKLIKRQALHACSVSFEFNGKDYIFSAPLPQDMERLLEILRKNSKQ